MQEERPACGQFEIRGEWWLPERPNNRVTGLLRYAAGEWIKLKLDESLKDHWVESEPGLQGYFVESAPFPSVHGRGVDGSACLLVDCVELGASVIGGALLVGRHSLEEVDTLFESAEVRLSDLEVWSEHSPFALPPQAFRQMGQHAGLIQSMFSSYPIPAIQGLESYKIHVAYGKKNLLALDVPSRQCRLEVWSLTAPSTSVCKSVTVEHGILLHIQPSVPRGVLWYRRFLTDCVRLFSFLMGKRAHRIRTTLFSSQIDASNVWPEFELYDRGGGPRQTETPLPGEMPLPFAHVEPTAEQAFDKWFAVVEGLSPVPQLLLETLPPLDTSLESVLLRLAQAIEAYYGRLVGQRYVLPEEYEMYMQAMLRALPEDVPKPLRDRLEKYLEFGNEYSLRSMIKHLMNGLDGPARSAIGVDNTDAFAHRAANTRNYLTHHTRQDGQVASTAREFLELTSTLRALLYGALAEYLGFDQSAVAHCVSKVRAGV